MSTTINFTGIPSAELYKTRRQFIPALSKIENTKQILLTAE